MAAKADYIDRITRKLIPKVTTGQIYWGAVPFVCIQVIMIGLVIAFPHMVFDPDQGKVDTSNVRIEVPQSDYGAPEEEEEKEGEEQNPPEGEQGGSSSSPTETPDEAIRRMMNR